MRKKAYNYYISIFKDIDQVGKDNPKATDFKKVAFGGGNPTSSFGVTNPTNSFGNMNSTMSWQDDRGGINGWQWGAGAGGALLTGLATKMFLDRNKEKGERGALFWPALMALVGGGATTYAANRLGLGSNK